MDTPYSEREAAASAIYARGQLEAAIVPKHPDQKFHRGDRVRIGNLPSTMSHFPLGDGTVVGSYNDQYAWMSGGHRRSEREPQYSIDIDGHGEVSWYPESTLTRLEGL